MRRPEDNLVRSQEGTDPLERPLSRGDFMKGAGLIVGSAMFGKLLMPGAAFGKSQEQDQNHFPALIPPGVKSIEIGVDQEAQQAVNQLHESWNGVFILHSPNKNSSVGFKDSPRAYAFPSTTIGRSVELGPTEKTTTIVVTQPNILKFKGRDYAAAFFPDTNRYGFLDIKWAADNGALKMFAYTDSAPKPIHYAGHPPLPETVAFDDKPWRESTIMRYKQTYVNGKIKNLRPSSVVPHS